MTAAPRGLFVLAREGASVPIGLNAGRPGTARVSGPPLPDSQPDWTARGVLASAGPPDGRRLERVLARRHDSRPEMAIGAIESGPFARESALLRARGRPGSFDT